MNDISNALQMALKHHQAGQLKEAESFYHQILQENPNHPDALNLSGLIAHQTINLHFGLLPRYGGCYPITWSVLNGEKQAGSTLHYMEENFDEGDILLYWKAHLKFPLMICPENFTMTTIVLISTKIPALKLDDPCCHQQLIYLFF